MFNILSKPKKQSTSQIVQQIHKEFYTEVDVLTDWAEKQNEVKNVKSDLLEKKERLEDLGFSKTKEMKAAEEELNRISKIKAKNNEKKTLLEAINYFSQKYPQYKFITEKSVQKICEKYGLVYGELSRYEGTVPDKNLDHMEQFSIDEEDCCYMHEYGHRNIGWGGRVNTKAISFDQYIDLLDMEDENAKRNPFGSIRHYDRINRVFQSPLEIAAHKQTLIWMDMK